MSFFNRHYNALSADIQNNWADFSFMFFYVYEEISVDGK